MAKKILIAILLSISLVSCNGILSTRESASVSFNLDMRELVPQTASPNSSGRFAIGGSLTVTASLMSSGTTIATTSKSATMDSIVPIEFITRSGQSVTVSVKITDSAGAVVYEGSSGTKTLTGGQNNITITILSRKVLFEEAGTSNLSWYTLYTTNKNASPSIDIGPGSIGDIDFDSYGNAYINVYGTGSTLITRLGSDIKTHDTDTEFCYSFAIDRARDRLYYRDPDGLKYFSLADFGDISLPPLLGDSYSVMLFTVHDNVVYTANIDRGAKINAATPTTITKHPISGTGMQLTAIATFLFSTVSPSLTDYYINDITWQDGYLWVLVSSLPAGYTETVGGSTKMKGALLQINPSTMELVATHGLTGETTRPDKNDNQRFFYGPTRFIALVPKKLIIADEGMYNLFNDATKKTQRNRIMTFDIATARLNAMDVAADFASTLKSDGCAFE